MPSLYEIDKQLLDTMDLETGEIIDISKFDELQMERNDKIENIALWYKNLLADAEAYWAEKNAFAERERSARSRADSLKRYLDSVLNGQKFSTVKVSISYRGSKSLEYDGESDIPEEYLKQLDPIVDKVAITTDIKNGRDVKGFTLVGKNNIQVK